MFSAEYYRNLKMLMLHLANAQGRGFIFASSLNQALIPSINNTLKQDMRSKNAPLSIVNLKEEELPLFTIQKAANEHPKHALVVNFLDILVVTKGADILQSLNYGREVLNKLNVPILFWASETTRQLLANQAIDLYSQRRFADVVFEDAPLSTERPSLSAHFDMSFKSTEEYQNIKFRITLLETQLEEAKAHNISVKSLCESLVPQLIKAYTEYNMYNDAEKLVQTYTDFFQGTAVQLEALVFYYYDIGNFEKALDLAQKILSLELSQGFEKTIEGQRELVGTYNGLARIYDSLNQNERTLEYSIRALTIQEKVLSNQEKILSKEHPDLAIAYANLGSIYIRLKQFDKALVSIQKALVIQEKILPLEHRDLARTYNDLAVTYTLMGENDKALEFNQKALVIREKILLAEAPDLAITYYNLADASYKLGDLHNAIDFMQKALTIQEKSLPKDHPNTVDTRKNLQFFLEQQQAANGK